MKFKSFMSEMVRINNLMSHIPPDSMSKKVLKPAQRNKMNTKIRKILKPTYFKEIPLDQLFNVLEKEGVVPLQEDNTYWSGLLIGGVDRTQMINFNLGWANEYKKINGMKQFMAISNAVLTMTYFKMQSGKYEVIAYVS